MNRFIIFGICCLFLSCSGKQTSTKTDRTNKLYINMGQYTPGTKLSLGEPLRACLDVAKDYTKLHPEISIQFPQQVSISGSQEGEWIKTQLVGGIAPDVIAQNAEITWQDIPKGWYIPLDEFLERPNPYIKGNTRWMDSFLNLALVNAKRAPNGKLYCLSMDIVETAIFYNKDLFKKYNLRVPKTWQEFMLLQEKLAAHNITPLASSPNLVANWGLDVIFDMLYYDIIEKLDVEESMESQSEYMTHYLTIQELAFLFQKGYFTRNDPRWVETTKLLKQWRKYWSKEMKNTDSARLFLSQRAAMVWDGSWFTRRLTLDPYIDFEWGIFYLPPITKETSKFAVGVQASVIGGSAVQLHVTNSALIYNHLEQVVDFLMFLTAPQNIEKVINEAKMMLPNVKNVNVLKELEPFNEIFKRRYCAVKWMESFDARHKSNWTRMMDLYLNDGISLEGYLIYIENNFSSYFNEKISTEKWDFSEYEKKWQENGPATIQ